MEVQEVKKSLLILKSQQQSLVAVETFLKNRDWKIHSTTNLKEALTYLIAHQPQFVLISIDFPNKKAKNLPKVLMSALPVCVAVFAEKAVTSSFTEVTNSATEYKLYPPVTGPAIERMVNKYLKDLTTKKNTSPDKDRLGLSGSGEDNSTIAIKGQLSAGLLAQMMGLDDGGGAIDGHIARDQKDDVMPSANWAHQMGSDTDPYTGQAVSKDKLGWIPSGTDLRNTDLDLRRSSDTSSTNSSDNSAEARAEKPTLAPQYSNEDFEGLDLRARNSETESKSRTTEAPGFGTNDDQGRKAPAHGSSDLKADLLTSKLNTYEYNNTLILKGTERTLDEVCVRTPPLTTDSNLTDSSTSSTSHVACIIIDSNRFSGYLVTAMGKNRKIDNTFLLKVKERLFNFLKENGERPNEDESSVHLKLRTVPFESWALDCADFLRKSIHEGNEVAMAFFPNEKVKAQFTDSAREDMAQISIEEVRCNIILEFNVYLYLPRNDKYILYTPKGGIFYEHQRKTLTDRGVRDVHVQRTELHLVTGLKVLSFLNDTIEVWEGQNPVNRVS